MILLVSLLLPFSKQFWSFVWRCLRAFEFEVLTTVCFFIWHQIVTIHSCWQVALPESLKTLSIANFIYSEDKFYFWFFISFDMDIYYYYFSVHVHLYNNLETRIERNNGNRGVACLWFLSFWMKQLKPLVLRNGNVQIYNMFLPLIRIITKLFCCD